jgi:hypothetical protein
MSVPVPVTSIQLTHNTKRLNDTDPSLVLERHSTYINSYAVLTVKQKITTWDQTNDSRPGFDNSKGKGQKRQLAVDKTLLRKLKIELHEPH